LYIKEEEIHMNTRANEFVTAFNYVKEQKALEEKKLRSNIEESVKNHQSELDRIYSLREARYNKVKEHNKLLESCKDEALATCLKAIYIEALEPGTLTDNGIIIAEDLVDSWIKAKGGASRIIAENRHKNYLINRICSIAEETALREVDEVESVGKEDEAEANSAGTPTTDEEKKNAKVTQLMAQAQALIAKATAIQNGEEVSDDTEASEAPAEEESSESEDSGEKIDASDLENEMMKILFLILILVMIANQKKKKLMKLKQKLTKKNLKQKKLRKKQKILKMMRKMMELILMILM
jgi:hypothetical protein